MIKKLLDVLSEHKDYLETLQGKVLYVADWKDENNGGISFTDYDVKRATVRLLNLICYLYAVISSRKMLYQ